MVSLIVLKKGIAYPEGHRERAKLFNRRLLEKYLPDALALLAEFPGSKIGNVTIACATNEEMIEFFDLSAATGAAHDAFAAAGTTLRQTRSHLPRGADIHAA